MTTSLAAGERVGKFIVTRHLGAGGMGTVYEARDPELSRAVAIKLVLDRAADPIRLLREAQALARISHPNVVGVYELGSHADNVFVAMELVDGVTIDHYLAEHRGSWRDVLALFVQAGRGLEAVHEQGLVHRDFKPSNVLVDREGRVRVGDFGLARRDDGVDSGGGSAISSDDARSTATTVDGNAATAVADPTPDRAALDAQITAEGAVVGTPRYMAPEQLAGSRVTRSADQYAFAVVLWEAIYGELPQDHLEAPDGTPAPAWVEKILSRALARSPTARWPSMTALLAALDRAPRRRTRIALGAGAVLIAAGVAALLATSMGGSAPIACERAGDSTTTTWSTLERSRVTAAFGAIGPLWAPSARPVVAELDRWSERSRLARIDACRATHELGTQSATLLDRRVACLDGQQAVFDALVGAISKADRSVAERALAAIEALPAPETCTATRLVDASPVGARPMADAIAEATVAVELQRPDARALTEKVVAASGALAPAIRARAYLLHARAVAATDPKQTRDELATALGAAAESRDPGLEAEILIATLLIAADGESADRIDALLPVARAAVTRAGDPTPLRRDLANAELGVHARLGRAEPAREACTRAVSLEESSRTALATARCECRIALLLREGAVPWCEKALELARDMYGEVHPRTLDFAHSRITALLRAGSLSEADAAARANVAKCRSLYGSDSTHVVVELQLLSVVQDRLERVAESRATLEEALAISDRVSGTGAAARSGLLMELADRALQQKDRAAIQFADSGIAAAEKLLGTEHRELAAALVIHAKAVALDPAQMPRAHESWRRAIAITEKNAGADSMIMASVLSSYAWFLATRELYVEALAPAERSIPIFTAVGQTVALARAESLIGEIHRELKHPAEARAWMTKARAHFVAAGERYADELAEVDANLAKLR